MDSSIRRMKTFNFLKGNSRYLRFLIPVKIKHRLKLFLDKILVPNPIVVHSQGIRLWRHPIDADSDYTRIISGTYEETTAKLLLSLLKPGMHFLDVGAHIGYFTVLVTKAVGITGKVWVFEPMPTTFNLLQRNIKNIIENKVSSIVEAVQKAVVDKSGFRMLFPHPLLDRSNMFERKGMNVENGVHVQTSSLDAFSQERGWSRIDVVKLDIEGAETMAIRGMQELIKRNPHIKLLVKFNPVMMKAANVTPEEFFWILQNVKFKKFSIVGHSEGFNIPADIPSLVEYAHKIKDNVNILCKRD